MNNQYIGSIYGELSKKEGLGQFANLRGGELGKKKGGGVFEEGLILSVHTIHDKNIQFHKFGYQ